MMGSKRVNHWTSGNMYECSEIEGSPHVFSLNIRQPNGHFATFAGLSLGSGRKDKMLQVILFSNSFSGLFCREENYSSSTEHGHPSLADMAARISWLSPTPRIAPIFLAE
jgi:hypothetical protein